MTVLCRMEGGGGHGQTVTRPNHGWMIPRTGKRFGVCALRVDILRESLTSTELVNRVLGRGLHHGSQLVAKTHDFFLPSQSPKSKSSPTKTLASAPGVARRPNRPDLHGYVSRHNRN